MNVGDRVQLKSGERGIVADNYLGAECRGLSVVLDAGGSVVVDQDEVTPAENKTWWIVLTPTPMRELNGVLVDDAGRRVHALMGPMEPTLVHDLAAHADPTVDVSVAHGWDQAPTELREAYERQRRVRDNAEEREMDGGLWQ